LTRKLIGLYGIKQIGETLEKVYVRGEKAIEKRTEKVETLEKPEKKNYNLRIKNEA